MTVAPLQLAVASGDGAIGDGRGAASWAARRRVVAVGLGVAGLAAYNWWVPVAFQSGRLQSINGFFSDLEATGMRDATLYQHLDTAAGVLLVAALLVRGAGAGGVRRREWPWMLAFAVAGGVGGRYAYACPEGISATCRHLEWHLQLPLHHYVHVVAGIAEFTMATVAVVLAVGRTRGSATWTARVFATAKWVLVVAYPLLGVAYLTDRLGALIEPVFFVTFSALVATELLEPVGEPVPAGNGALVRARRRCAERAHAVTGQWARHRPWAGFGHHAGTGGTPGVEAPCAGRVTVDCPKGSSATGRAARGRDAPSPSGSS